MRLVRKIKFPKLSCTTTVNGKIWTKSTVDNKLFSINIRGDRVDEFEGVKKSCGDVDGYNGVMLASGPYSSKLEIWNTDKKELIASIKSPNGFYNLAPVKDYILLLPSPIYQVEAYDLQGNKTNKFDPIQCREDRGRVNEAAYFGECIFVGYTNGDFAVWDYQTVTFLGDRIHGIERVKGLFSIPDRLYIVYAGNRVIAFDLALNTVFSTSVEEIYCLRIFEANGRVYIFTHRFTHEYDRAGQLLSKYERSNASHAVVWNECVFLDECKELIQITEPPKWSFKSHKMFEDKKKETIKELVKIHRIPDRTGNRYIKCLPRDVLWIICSLCTSDSKIDST